MIEICVILYIIGCIINYHFVFVKHGIDEIKDSVSLIDDSEDLLKDFDIIIKISIFLSWITIFMYLKKEQNNV